MVQRGPPGIGYPGISPRFFRIDGALLLFAAVTLVLGMASWWAYAVVFWGGSPAIAAGVLVPAVAAFVIGSLKAYQLRIKACKLREPHAQR